MKFESLGHETPAADLEFLRELGRSINIDEFREAIEIGSFVGNTALALQKEFHVVYCIDTWVGNEHDPAGSVVARGKNSPETLFTTFCRNMGPLLYDSVIPCVGPSSIYSSIWPRQVDLIFIDAEHSYESVKHDIMIWKRHVKRGGILCGHDYGIFPGVTKAVHEYLPGFKTGGRSIWWITM